MTSQQNMIALGLALTLLGAVVHAIYANKTIGATGPVDRDYAAARWPYRVGWWLIAAGFGLQLIGTLSG